MVRASHLLTLAAVVLAFGVYSDLPVVAAYRTKVHRVLQTVLPASLIANVTPAQRLEVAVKKATCPFIGSIVNEGSLPLHQSLDKPLANIADVVALGNTGPHSTLGYVLQLFATGNHAKQVGSAPGVLNAEVANTQFSLDFPGSQGSHAGHSGILQGNHKQLNSGRWSEPDFQRLLSKAVNGQLSVQAIGHFIAENIAHDPQSKTLTSGLLPVAVADAGKLLGHIAPAVTAFLGHPSEPQAGRQVAIDVTKLLGDDNLIGSSGEFGLLLAFLEGSPATKAGTFAVSDITHMFKEHRLPAGWEKWTKSGLSWVKFTSELAFHARVKLGKK